MSSSAAAYVIYSLTFELMLSDPLKSVHGRDTKARLSTIPSRRPFAAQSISFVWGDQGERAEV